MKQNKLGGKAILYMILLTIQFGLQPMLTNKFTPKTVCKSSVILVQETTKFLIAMTMLATGGSFSDALKGWSISSWLRVAVLPAGLYTIQNAAALTAYQNLDGVTFNVLNQTKTLSAALCCYLLIGRKQSKVQILSLFILFISALIIEGLIPLVYFTGRDIGGKGELKQASETQLHSSRHFTYGVLPVLLASFISGLAGAISQKNLQNGGRNALLFSSELCVASIITLLISLTFSADGQSIQRNGFFHEWTGYCFIPILSNAIGGIIVGLVTKYAGSVRKGFALIFGLVFTGLVQSFVDQIPLSKEQLVGGSMAALSVWLHSTNPPIGSVTNKASASNANRKLQKQD
mmetsp:Transcript_10919/g.12042  ORF Transcript_10919/g.12042 Transcript_10919/m.12042 type:complete len:347 (-) Transcript_10919:97-1137(-)